MGLVVNSTVSVSDSDSRDNSGSKTGNSSVCGFCLSSSNDNQSLFEINSPTSNHFALKFLESQHEGFNFEVAAKKKRAASCRNL